MRLAVISDIHGNLVSLEAVLAEIEPANPDRIICLGDVAEAGPYPHQVVDRLRVLGIPTVMGNTDARLLDPQPYEPVDQDTRRSSDIERWCLAQLTPEDLAFMRSFQPTISVALEGGATLLCFHGSPVSNTDAILATTPEEELEPMLQGWSAPFMIGAHTHTPLLRRVGETLIINPGSVGMPFVQPRPGVVRRPLWAEYAWISSDQGCVRIDLRRVPIERDALARSAFSSSMPHAEWWLQEWMV